MCHICAKFCSVPYILVIVICAGMSVMNEFVIWLFIVINILVSLDKLATYNVIN